MIAPIIHALSWSHADKDIRIVPINEWGGLNCDAEACRARKIAARKWLKQANRKAATKI
jgi:hypothetical protein